MGLTLDRPDPNQIEISVFGPGYGESSAIHLGSGKWMIIDSCVDRSSKEPTCLKYLRSIGVKPETEVLLIIVTHWHDDHIRGLSRMIDICQKAKICLSAAIGSKEAITLIETFNSRNEIAVGTGVSEMATTLNLIHARKRRITRASENTRLLAIVGKELSHGMDCAVWALSPSGNQFDRAIAAFKDLQPSVISETKRRAPDVGPNHLSVVTWISIGKLALLMGADLEETGDQNLGWSAIAALSDRPEGRASFFKIPHHGSSNAHCEKVWSDLLMPQPTAILTPWNKNVGLPSPEDVKRICGLTNNAYISSTRASPHVQKRSPIVEKQIRETFQGKLRISEPLSGQVRIRTRSRSVDGIFDNWSVEFSNTAGPLASFVPKS